MRVALAALLVLLALLLGACSVTPTRELPDIAADELWSDRQQRLLALDTWGFRGRAAVSGSDVSSRTMRIHWAQGDETFDLAFMTLLGQRVAELNGEPGEVVLRMPGEEPVVAADSHELLTRVLGWSAPVESLRYWVLGLPHPLVNDEAGEIDAWGRMTQLQQGDWRVEFDRYIEIGVLDLPRRLTVVHPELRIRLIIDHWDI